MVCETVCCVGNDTGEGMCSSGVQGNQNAVSSSTSSGVLLAPTTAVASRHGWTQPGEEKEDWRLRAQQ